MDKPKIFISYSHRDESWKNRLQKHLEVLDRRGSLGFWEDRQIAAGAEWHAEINAALESAEAAILLISVDFLSSKFIRDQEVPTVLQRRIQQGMKVFPLLLRSCPWQGEKWLSPLQLRPTDGKPLAQYDKDDDIDRVLAEFASEIERLLDHEPALAPATTTAVQGCPYLGLEAFTEDEAHLFFGRNDFSAALFAKVKQNDFVALVGPSGCGKSSVVQAGLFPRLRRDTAVGWQTLIFQPNDDPFYNLADEFIEFRKERIKPASERDRVAESLANQLRDASTIGSYITQSLIVQRLDPQRSRLLLIVDQFEELFTLTSEEDRQALIKVLLAAKETAPVTIMLTLRADFMGQAQSLSPVFSQLLDEGIVSHRPLSRADLEAIITGPAQSVGLKFEPKLVDQILDDVAVQPDSLPLLEYALKEMWHKRQGPEIGYELYEAIGKVEGAISKHADAVLQKLPVADRALALHALTRLVRVASEENEADTRLRLPLRELSAAERKVLQEFVDKKARLLATKGEEDQGTATIEVAHEALIRRWGKLREALDRNREFLMWRRRLDTRRKAWEQKGRDDKWLLFGGEDDDARRWLHERQAELGQAEIEFITWIDRPDYQIGRVLAKANEPLLSSDEESRNNWFSTLVFCGEKEMALSITREIKAADYRARALGSIAEALGKAGLATEAREANIGALAAAREIEAADYRAQALIMVAEYWLKQGQSELARSLVDEVRNAVSKSFDDNNKSSSLRHLAAICARLHSYREARRYADLCSSSSDRMAAYTAILREYYIERQPSLARLFAEEVAEAEQD